MRFRDFFRGRTPAAAVAVSIPPLLRFSGLYACREFYSARFAAISERGLYVLLAGRIFADWCYVRTPRTMIDVGRALGYPNLISWLRPSKLLFMMEMLRRLVRTVRCLKY